MNIQIKNLMNSVIQKFGGIFKREGQRTFWESPTGDKFHASTVFLRRMAMKEAEQQNEPVVDAQQPKQEEVSVNGIGEPQPESGRSEEAPETIEKVEEEGTPIETPKKKKKSRKKETKSEVENAPQQGQKDEIKEQE